MNKFYITTAIPYVNGKPHIGHALEYFIADTIRRYHDLLGDKTLLLSGADENALKNIQAAEKENAPIQEFLDRNSRVFKDAYEKLEVHLDVFQRGSDKEKHFPGVQELWNRCMENGDIYKKAYTGLYCVGCESFKTEEELIDGLCPDHQKAPEKVTEENYFFKLSNYQEKLIQLIESNEFRITPQNKRAETLSFIKSGLQDFSISRSKDRAKGVGVPVPNDPEQVIYVWFDALAIYITGIGYGRNEEEFKTWWPANVHVIGKDINRFHTAYWPAMLLAAKLEIPKQILIHSFIQSGGQKMSKTLGNVIDPFEMVAKYGIEPFRYYMLSQIPIDQDGDFSETKFREIYNADLANGLGNLVARVAKLAEKIELNVEEPDKTFIHPDVKKPLEEFKFNEALAIIWEAIRDIDRKINVDEPWKLKDAELKTALEKYIKKIQHIASSLQPFLPKTAEKILSQFSGKVRSSDSLFPRLS